MKVKLEKVYKVTFMQYTNVMKDTISDWDGKGHSLADCEYLDVGKEAFLLRESQLDCYRKFGGGYRNIEFVGQIPVSETDVNVSHPSNMVLDLGSNTKYFTEGPVGSESTRTPLPPPGVTITSTNDGES